MSAPPLLLDHDPAKLLGRIDTLKPEDGDVIVVRLTRSVSFKEAETIHAMLKSFFDGHKILVLDDGTSIERIPSDALLKRIDEKLDLLLER